MRAVKLKNVVNRRESELEVKCVFAAIGHEPNTAPFRGKVDTDEAGYLVQQGGTFTNVPGVFAAATWLTTFIARPSPPPARLRRRDRRRALARRAGIMPHAKSKGARRVITLASFATVA